MNKLVFAALFLLFAACSGSNKQSATQETVSTEAGEGKKYSCPMQCEGEKTYVEAGKCPVCKMDLEEIALAESDSTGQAH